MTRIALLIAASLWAPVPADASADGEPWSAPPPPVSGEACQGHDACAPGEYCSADGTCEGSGFCDADWQCPAGFVCDARATCVPADESAPDPPIPACETITTEIECFARADCAPIYIGVGCTCDGAPCACSAGDPNCVCERYEFAGCSSL